SARPKDLRHDVDGTSAVVRDHEPRADRLGLLPRDQRSRCLLHRFAHVSSRSHPLRRLDIWTRTSTVGNDAGFSCNRPVVCRRLCRGKTTSVDRRTFVVAPADALGRLCHSDLRADRVWRVGESSVHLLSVLAVLSTAFNSKTRKLNLISSLCD